MADAALKPKTFRSQAAFREWLVKHHATERELTIRLFKVHAATRGLTYRQALDEALCFGWIDGIVRRYDEDSFTQRYTPRKPRSTWSRVNVGHVQRLIKEGRMMPAGRAAFDARKEDRTGTYSFEQRDARLAPTLARTFRANAAAWADYQNRPPSYRRLTTHWVMSAKREETRAKRFALLLGSSAVGRKIPQLERLDAGREGRGSQPSPAPASPSQPTPPSPGRKRRAP
jgi:uncharacterized protein YdeI (YjbR/CyaY-like superfamily)